MKSRSARPAAAKRAVGSKNNAKRAGAKSAGVKRAPSAAATVEVVKIPVPMATAAKPPAGKHLAAEPRTPAPSVPEMTPAVEAAAGAGVADDAAQSRRAGLKLEPSCTLRDALDMQFQLLATDFGDSDVLLDGSAVERIDTAGLQMLVAFAKQHATGGRRMQWIAASQELQRSSRLLGLDEALGLIPSPPEVSGGH